MKKIIILILFLSLHYSLYGQSTYNRGVNAFNLGNYEEAYRFFKLAETESRPDKQFYIYFAVCAEKAGYYDAADILRRGLKYFPGDADLSLVLVQYLSEENKFQPAMQTLENARENILPEEFNKLMAILAFNEGVRLYQKNSKSKSLAYFRKAVHYNDKDPRFIRNLAVVLWETGKKEDAISLLEKYLPHFADDADMNSLLLAFYQKSGNLTKLQSQLEKRLRTSSKIEDYLALQQFYLLTSNDNKANELFDKMEKIFPKEKKIYLTPIRYYRRIFLYDRADSLLNRMQRQFPYDTLVCKLKAENYEDMDSLKQAVKYWHKCLKLHGNKPDWHFRILKDLKKTDSLWYAAYLDTMKTVLTSAEDRFKTALILRNDKRIKEAKAILEDLYSADPSDGATLTYLGLCCQEAGQDSQAVYYFEKAISEKNALPQAYMALAHHFGKNGEIKKSDDYFKLGLDLLLKKLSQTQKKIVKPLQSNLLDTSRKNNLSEVAEQYEDYEKLLKNELSRYVKIHSADNSRIFLSRMLESYPKNVFLRLLLCDLAIDSRQYDKAETLINDALFLKPGYPPALRRLITAARLQKDDTKLFRAYLTLLYQQPQEFSENDYRQLIETARRIGQLDNLSRQMVSLYRRDKGRKRLKRFTIECLHYAGNHEQARQIAAEVSQKKHNNNQIQILNNKI
jgi:tetratricopeptide (TPR) repeat protein